MVYRLNRIVRLSELCSALKIEDFREASFAAVGSFSNATSNCLTFSNKAFDSASGVVIAPELPENVRGFVSPSPRFAFVRALDWLDRAVGFEKPTANPDIGEGVSIGLNAAIGKGVTIGAGTDIGHNVVIRSGVTIGRNCLIKSNCVIGEAGFGMERHPDGTPIRFVHLGSVVIGDRVEIGSLTTVCQGTLGDTVIEDDAKIDDHVHVAHNCRVRRGAFVIANVVLAGGSDIGENAWISPNAAVLQKTKVGDRALVGLGAVVTRDVPSDAKVVGNPARILRANNDE